MKARLVTSTDPAEFDRDLNNELSQIKKIVTVQFSTARTEGTDGEWDTVYSAVIIYEKDK